MKKIGIFTGYFLPHLGGVERYVDKLSSALSKLGYGIVIVTFNDSDQVSVEKNQTYTIYRLPVLSIAKDRYPLPRVNSDYREVIKAIEREEIDFFLVNTRFHLTSLIGARMGKRQRKPVMLVEHGTDHFTVGNKALDFFGLIYEHILTFFIKRNVDKFYGVSKNCCIWLKHFGITASGVFYNAIDAKDKLTVSDTYNKHFPSDEIVITYAGRLIKEKGILNLIEAFARLKNVRGEIKLAIAGSGELLSTIQDKYADEDIDILGKLNFENVMSLYKRTDIFVHPSLYPEGLPTSILEAGLMECAIVATPRGGTEEVIIDDSHGKIVDGSVDSLYNAILHLIDDSADRKACATKVMQRVETTFDWNAVAKEVDRNIMGF